MSAIGDEGEAQALRATAEDGAYENLYPTTEGQRCVGWRFGQVERCVRLGLLGGGPYADANCSEPLGELFGDCDAPPSYLLDEQTREGVSTLIAAHVAEAYTGAVDLRQVDACQLAHMSPGVNYFERGAAVDLDTFPVIIETTDP